MRKFLIIFVAILVLFNGVIDISAVGPDKDLAGIALTFDDSFVDQWFKTRDIFNKYNAKATFFVSNFDKLTDSQIEKLHILENDGHEIGCHTLDHKSVEDYPQNAAGLQAYLNEQVIAEVKVMKEKGFDPVNFAFVGGLKSQNLQQALLGYFHFVRSTCYPREDQKIEDFDGPFFTPGKYQRLLFGLGIDDKHWHSVKELTGAFRRAKQKGQVMILYGHVPSDDPEKGTISFEKLEQIIKTANDMDLKFYRIKDLLNCKTDSASKINTTDNAALNITH